MNARTNEAPVKLPELGPLFAQAYRLYRERWRTLLLLALLASIPTVTILGALVASIGLPDWLFAIITAAVFLIGSASLAAAAVSEQPLGVREAFRFGLRLSPSYLGLSLLTVALVGGGLILLVVPGVIIALRLSLAPFILMEGRSGVVESLRRSNEYVRGATAGLLWRFIILGLAIAVPELFGGILTSLSQGFANLYAIALAWLLGPFIALYTVAIYRSLVEQKGKPTLSPLTRGQKAGYGLFAAFGCLGLLVLFYLLVLYAALAIGGNIGY